jgi:hypothetical protein
VHVDAGWSRQDRDLPDDGTTALQLLPPAAAARTDHNLGDLVSPSEFKECLRGVVSLNFIPMGADVGGQLAEEGQLLVLGASGSFAGRNVQNMKLCLYP